MNFPSFKKIKTHLGGHLLVLGFFIVFLSLLVGFLCFFAESPFLIFFPTLVLVVFFVLFVFATSARVSRISFDSFLDKEKLFVITNDLEDGLVIYSPAFEVFFFNRAAENIFSLQKDKVVGKTLAPELGKEEGFRTLTQVIFPSLASSISQLSEVGTWPQVVDVFTEPGGRKFHTVLSKISDENGRVVCFLKIIKDETRERAIIQSKNEFINTAAHQLRTPLTAINWALENIVKLSEGQSSDIHSVATEAVLVSEKTLKITNDLLDVAKIEEGKFGYSFRNVEMVSFIKDIVETLSPFAKQRSMFIVFSHGGVEKINATIDPDRLGLAVFNLIDNAIKYNTRDHPVDVVLEMKGEDKIKISVKDSGVGIPEEERQNIFGKFYRATNAAQVEPNGSGLGLFIVKNIVRRHGGVVGFESVQGRGTTFWIEIPLKGGGEDSNTSSFGFAI